MIEQWASWTIYRKQVVLAAFRYTQEAAVYIATKRTERESIRAVHSTGIECVLPMPAKGDKDTILKALRFMEPPHVTEL